GLYTSDKFESSNLNDDLRARGLTTISKILKIYDTGVTLGGPIKKDKLWFFASFREWGNQHLMAGNFWNKTQGTPFYTPDLSHPADRAQGDESKAARVTGQGAQKHNFNFFADVADDCLCRAIGALGSAPEAGIAFHFRPGGLYQADWSAPITPKLLFEGGGAFSFPAGWPLSSRLERADHAEAAVRGRRLAHDHALANLPQSRGRAVAYLHPGDVEKLQIQRVGELRVQTSD